MKVLTVNGTDYKVKFGYNCFCDTDLMDRVKDLIRLFQDEEVEDANDVSRVGKIKELFCTVRELIFVGFQKHNPAGSLQEVGDLLDDYVDEETEESRSLLTLFTMLSEELFNEGFLSDLVEKGSQEQEKKNGAKAPADHKKAAK